MKLRFYLRGIGIGIIVAAAICICGSLRNSKMSDEQVKKRAAELGMIQGGEVLMDLGQPITSEPGLVYEEIAGYEPKVTEAVTEEQPEVTEEENTAEVAEAVKEEVTPEPSKEEVKKEEPAKEEIKKEPEKKEEPVKEEVKKEEPAKEEVKKEEPAKEEVKKEPEKKEEPAKEEVKKEEPAKEEKPASGDTVTIVVEKGNGSDTVARKLAGAGLISDAAAYDKWLCQNGYDRYIAAGTHQIPKNATQEQIAKILTGRN